MRSSASEKRSTGLFEMSILEAIFNFLMPIGTCLMVTMVGISMMMTMMTNQFSSKKRHAHTHITKRSL
jgi:uncharacterized membrane protein YuzA (DUF378 family)